MAFTIVHRFTYLVIRIQKNLNKFFTPFNILWIFKGYIFIHNYIQLIPKIITKNNKKLSLLKTPIRFDTENHVDKTAPELGEHNEEILNKLGYSNEDIKLLKNKDIV